MPGGAQLVDRDDEVQPGEDRAEAEDERAHRGGRDRRLRSRCCTACRTSSRCRPRPMTSDVSMKIAPMHPEVVAREVQPRERDVLRAEHERQHEVAERRRDARDDHQEHHDRAVQREHLVVGVVLDDGLAGREELGAQEQREEAAERERRRARETRYMTPIRLWSSVSSPGQERPCRGSGSCRWLRPVAGGRRRRWCWGLPWRSSVLLQRLDVFDEPVISRSLSCS